MGTRSGHAPGERRVTLLTRAGCASCSAERAKLELLLTEPAFTDVELDVVDVDEVAGTDPELRAEYGDRVPVVLLDGVEHSYWTVDEPRLRRDLAV